MARANFPQSFQEVSFLGSVMLKLLLPFLYNIPNGLHGFSPIQILLGA